MQYIENSNRSQFVTIQVKWLSGPTHGPEKLLKKFDAISIMTSFLITHSALLMNAHCGVEFWQDKSSKNFKYKVFESKPFIVIYQLVSVTMTILSCLFLHMPFCAIAFFLKTSIFPFRLIDMLTQLIRLSGLLLSSSSFRWAPAPREPLKIHRERP